jgi:hypothetical protein
MSICLLLNCNSNSNCKGSLEIHKLIFIHYHQFKHGTYGRKKGSREDKGFDIVESCIEDESFALHPLRAHVCAGQPRPLISSGVFTLENGSTTLPVLNKPEIFTHTSKEVKDIIGKP